jgi:hypothetical protein
MLFVLYPVFSPLLFFLLIFFYLLFFLHIPSINSNSIFNKVREEKHKYNHHRHHYHHVSHGNNKHRGGIEKRGSKSEFLKKLNFLRRKQDDDGDVNEYKIDSSNIEDIYIDLDNTK